MSNSGDGGFCAAVWAETAGWRQAMVEHPFLVELTAGTLPADRFRWYLIQDSHYLRDFARALAAAAATADDGGHTAWLAAAAAGVLTVERALHERYFTRWDLTPADVENTGKSPTCAAYTDHLLATAYTGSQGELLAALLPCFWVYADVATQTQTATTTGSAKTPGSNPYQDWIDTYDAPGFQGSVHMMRDLTEQAATAAGPAERSRMREAFRRSTTYEWMFFDAAYHLRTWPSFVATHR